MELDKHTVVESILIFFDNKILADFHLRYKEKIEEARKTAGQDVELFLAFKKDGFIDHYMSSLEWLLQSGSLLSGEMRRLKLVATRKRITGRHTGEIFGILPSKKEVVIHVIDIIRLKDGRYVGKPYIAGSVK